MLGTLLRKTNAASDSNTTTTATATTTAGHPVSHFPSVPTNSNATTLTTKTDALFKSSNQFNSRNSAISSLILENISNELKYKLFGTKHLAFTEDSYAKYCFRVLIAEETGQIACKNHHRFLLDYSYPQQNSGNLMKIRQNELKQYIFGSLVPSMSNLQNDKFRSIPNSKFIIITRIFHANPGSNGSSSKNRFSISLCVPNFLTPVIAEAWTFINIWLDQSQNVISSHLNFLMRRNQQGGILSIDYGTSSFSKDIDKIISNLTKNLLPCLRSFVELPRLILYPNTYSNFIDIWFKDCFNWIEIKDGPKLIFLQTLIALILFDYNDALINPTVTTRIIILSGNSVVANKLIFILNGLLKPKFHGNIANFVKVGNNEVNRSGDYENDVDPILALDEPHVIKPFEKTKTMPIIKRNVSHSVGKGWEIPKKTSSSYGSVSISSDESSAEVIQPSSFKSNNNSLHYLSSSLSSSQAGSYGSWFNKRPSLLQFSPSMKISHNNDSWEKISSSANHNVHRTSSSVSLHQSYLRPNDRVTPQHSPAISEYDEYPWFNTPESLKIDSTLESTATTTTTTTTTTATSKQISEKFPLRNIEIARNCQRISQSKIIDDVFDSICKPGESLVDDGCKNNKFTRSTSSKAAVLEIAQMNKNNHCTELLPRYTTYLPHFNNWFKLQGNPITIDSEATIVNSMKTDLENEFFTRSLIVSLRKREIKEIIIKRDVDKTNLFKQKVHKVFSNGKFGNISIKLIDFINFINNSLKRARTLYEDEELSILERDNALMSIFLSMIHYCDE